YPIHALFPYTTLFRSDAADHVSRELRTFEFWKILSHARVTFLPDFEIGELPGIDQIEIEAVIEIVRVVGNFIGEIGDLRLERRRSEEHTSELQSPYDL